MNGYKDCDISTCTSPGCVGVEVSQRSRTPDGIRLPASATYGGVIVSEAMALAASPIACAVADAWITAQGIEHGEERKRCLFAALDRLEAATRNSPLRKVCP